MDTHSLVAFDPQEEHALHLHVCGIYFMCEQLGLEQVYSWFPRILGVVQTRVTIHFVKNI